MLQRGKLVHAFLPLDGEENPLSAIEVPKPLSFSPDLILFKIKPVTPRSHDLTIAIYYLANHFSDFPVLNF